MRGTRKIWKKFPGTPNMFLKRWTCAKRTLSFTSLRNTPSRTSCTLRRNRTWTAPSPARVISFTTNVVGTFNLLEACRTCWPSSKFKVQGSMSEVRFHHVSTDEVYGSLGSTGYFTEKTPYAPNSPYSASKASPATSCALIITLTDCRPSSRIARTITARINSPKSSSRLSSKASLRANRFQFTATA